MVAAVAIGATVVSGAMQSDAAGKAAGMQAGAADRSTSETQRQYNQNREDTRPYREAGYEALDQQRTGLQVGGDFNRDFTLADFKADPGYQFRMAEGLRGIEGSAAARGGLLSGGTLKAMNSYGQELASSEYGTAYQRFNADRDRRFNRLSSVAGTGQTATIDTARMGTAATESANQTRMAGADARSAGVIGSANAWSNSLVGGANYYTSLSAMNKVNPVAAGAGSPTVMSGSFIPVA